MTAAVAWSAVLLGIALLAWMVAIAVIWRDRDDHEPIEHEDGEPAERRDAWDRWRRP